MITTHTAAVVVMYHPEISFLENIATYLNEVGRLYIIDNTEVHNADLFKTFSQDPKVIIIADNINYGIAKAMNIAAEKAIQDGYAWLLTMDQDSSFNPQALADYFQSTHSYPAKENVAIFGLPYDKNFLSSRSPGERYIEVNSVISSGSLVNLRLFKTLGGFDEKLFIDEVDHDYCYRAVMAGYKIVVVKVGLLQHSLGKSLELGNRNDSSKRLKTLHNPLRIYYIVRNGLYISGTYKKDFPKESARRRKIIYVTVKNNFLHGDQKLDVVKYTLLGLWHKVIGRYGKLR